MSRGRITAIIIVALLHALLGYAFISGLAYNVIKEAAEDLKTFDVEEEPPPPEEEPPPPPPDQPQPATPPPIASPPPIVRTNTPPPVVQAVPNPPPFIPTPRADPAPPAPPAPPPPPPPPAPPRVVQTAKAKGSLQGLIRSDDYPESAAERGDQGTVRVRLSIGTDGRVSNCSVTSSSGSSQLDSATCRILRARARYTPAKDNNGNPIADSDSATIRWVLEG